LSFIILISGSHNSLDIKTALLNKFVSLITLTKSDIIGRLVFYKI